MRFVHAADLHLDSPLRGLERYPGAPVEAVRGATRRAFENLIDLCITERAVLLLLAGDVFDGDWVDYNTGLFLNAQLNRLRPIGTRVVTIRGNHDAQSQIVCHLRLPEHVTELSSTAPETVELTDLGVAVHGQSYPMPDVLSDLSANYPVPRPGLINMGLLHTAADGRPGHSPVAPCKPESLRRRGYDYWALGHVHRREILSEDPWIVFPGVLQGRHVKELGPKGCMVGELRDGRVAEVTFRAVDTVRWLHREVDTNPAATPETVLARIDEAVGLALDESDGRPVALRLSLVGQAAVPMRLARNPDRWLGRVRSRVTEASRGRAWLAQLDLATRAPENGRPAHHGNDDPIAELFQLIRGVSQDAGTVAELHAELAEFYERLPPEAWQLQSGLDRHDPGVVRELLSEVEDLLLGRLIDERW